MFEYNVEKMSEQELLEAANKIFTAQEKDFEKIKSEKWYQTLFHAITLNQDGKKYAVKGISSLAKLQQLFMNIYVKNYRKSHEQLDKVIDAVTKQSELIKNLYGMCVYSFEEQDSLESLDDFDAEILALFLGVYKDESGSVPSEVQDYNRGVILSLKKKTPIGNLDNHQISKLRAPKVVYRCFMEQCAVGGTIDTEEWPDQVYELLKDFELSYNSKTAIKEAVKYEMETYGTKYFILKYTQDDRDVLDDDFEILEDGYSDEKMTPNQNGYTNNNNPCSCAKDFSHNEDETISTMLCIETDDKVVFKNKNIHIQSYINCDGILEFDNCIIYYNESNSGDEITLDNNAQLKITNSKVVCKKNDETYFISCKGFGVKVSLLNSDFEDCGYFLNSDYGSVEVINCNIINAYTGFLKYGSNGDDPSLDIRNNKIVLETIPSFFNILDENGFAVSYYNYIFDIEAKTDDVFSHNYFCEKGNFAGDKRVQFLRGNNLTISHCYFESLSRPVEVSFITNCKFENCSNVVEVLSRFDEEESYIKKCVFVNCKDTVSADMTSLLVSRCQFIFNKGFLIHSNDTVIGGSKIEFCEFINTESFDLFLGFSNSLIQFLTENNTISKCVFNGVNLGECFLIAAKSTSKPSGDMITIEDCTFMNCRTQRSSKKIIKEYIQYDALFKKNIDYHAVYINSDCKGLDKINAGKAVADEYEIKDVLSK